MLSLLLTVLQFHLLVQELCEKARQSAQSFATTITNKSSNVGDLNNPEWNGVEWNVPDWNDLNWNDLDWNNWNDPNGNDPNWNDPNWNMGWGDLWYYEQLWPSYNCHLF
jgi:hypothetical protein